MIERFRLSESESTSGWAEVSSTNLNFKVENLKDSDSENELGLLVLHSGCHWHVVQERLSPTSITCNTTISTSSSSTIVVVVVLVLLVVVVVLVAWVVVTWTECEHQLEAWVELELQVAARPSPLAGSTRSQSHRNSQLQLPVSGGVTGVLLCFNFTYALLVVLGSTTSVKCSCY